MLPCLFLLGFCVKRNQLLPVIELFTMFVFLSQISLYLPHTYFSESVTRNIFEVVQYNFLFGLVAVVQIAIVLI
jgi:hypothetical protein